MLQPLVCRTWVPKGQTPIHYSWDRRDRLSAISALSVSPSRRRLSLYFDVFDYNIVTDDFERFVESLLRQRRRGIILVLDRWSVHRAGVRRLQRRFQKRLRVEWLPAYAPDLNPTEQVWNRTKRTDLGNFLPDDTIDLRRAVRRSLHHAATEQKLLRSFFKHAKLKL